jgi:hypothetical protein
VVSAVLLLFPPFGSEVAALTVAVLLKVVAAVAFEVILTTKVKKLSLPDGRLGFVQLTVPLLPAEGVLHVQPPGEENETKVMPDGKGSLKVTVLALFGPALKTSMV